MDLRYSQLKFIMIFAVFVVTLMLLLSFGFIGRELTYYYELTSEAGKEDLPKTFIGSIGGIMAWNVFMLFFFPLVVYSSFNWSKKMNLVAWIIFLISNNYRLKKII